MASKNLFRSLLGALLPKPDAVNEESAPAYAYTPRHILAQLAATGCFHRKFYASGEKQLESVLESARQVEPAFVARTAGATETMRQWGAFRARNQRAKLVCIDLQPHGTTQAAERPDVLNIGGFSDRVFDVIREFASGRLDADHWVGVIEKVEL